MNTDSNGSPPESVSAKDLALIADYHAEALGPRGLADAEALLVRNEGARHVLDALERTRRDLEFYGLRDTPPLPRDFGALFDTEDPVDTKDPVQVSPNSSYLAELEDSPQQSRVRIIRLSLRRRPARLLLAAAALALVLIGVGIPVLLRHSSGGGELASPTSAPPSVSSSAPPTGQVAQNRTVSVPTARDDLGRVDLVIGGVGSASAYFGSLQALSDTLGPSIDLGVTSANSSQCAETVVASGVPGRQGAIYAVGINGWGAAEGAPSQDLQASGGAIHQQSITPPASARVGYKVSASAQIVSDAINASSGQFRLELVSIADQGKASWTLSGTLGSANVTCTLR